MAYKANILLGRITKLHGFQGAVTVRLEKTFIEKVPDMETVFLEIEGKPVPFFISESEYPGADSLRLKFEGYNSVEEINTFIGCSIFLTSGKPQLNNNKIGDLSGYTILLSDNSRVGTVIETIENPGQWLLVVQTENGNKILVPLHEDLIIKINNNNKVLLMELPEGLTGIN
jgi:16S rRNA processing protein RimM